VIELGRGAWPGTRSASSGAAGAGGLDSFVNVQVETHANQKGDRVMAVCTHLEQVQVERPEGVEGCEDCLAIGGSWVHLRVCRSCGHVACCDSSPNRHASAHARASEHPIVTSVEPGELWSYCYVDDVAFVLEPAA
jgi:uncharacterized UBP type Zn finger protein